MRKDDGIEMVICHDFQDALLQLGTLLKAQSITVVQLETLRFPDVLADIGMKLARLDDLLQGLDRSVAIGKITI